METKLDWEGDHRLIATCSGELGWDDQAALPRRIEDALGIRPQPQVLMDLEAVREVNSAGIGALIRVSEVVHRRGGRMIIANVTPALRQMFAAIGLDRLIRVTDTLHDAREAFDGAT